jgi:hypothetical protein
MSIAARNRANQISPATCSIREVQLAKREFWQRGKRLGAELVAIASIAAVLGLMGPFGSYRSPIEVRVPLWIGNMTMAYLLYSCLWPLGDWLTDQTPLARWAGRLLIIFLGAIPLTFMIEFMIRSAAPVAPDLPFATRYLQVLGIGLITNLLMARFFSAPAPPPEAAGEFGNTDEVGSRPRILDRLPPSFGDRLYCLSSEDHYVRAHGEYGSALILMRMRDAVAELDGIPGLRVHRSWWVARDALERVERDGKTRLILVNGIHAPVARSYEGAVRSLLPART